MLTKRKKLVSKKGLREEFGIPYSPQHIARLEKLGQFPKRIKLGNNRVAWLESDIVDWIDSVLLKPTNFSIKHQASSIS